MEKKFNTKAIEEQERKLGRKLTAEEKARYEIKPYQTGDIQNKIMSSISGQNGIEKSIKNKNGHILDIADRALNKVLNKIDKAAY